MKTLAAAVLVATLPLVAAAGPLELYTFQMGDVVAHLHDAPCDHHKMHDVLREPGEFRSAAVEWQGRSFVACWAVVGQQVVVVDETGDSGFLQPEGFRDGKTPVSLRLRGA